MKKYFKWSNVRLFLMFGIVIFLFSFTSKRNEHRRLKNTAVHFTTEDNLFVTSDMVNKLLIEKNRRPQSVRKDNLDLNILEKAVNSHEMIERSEVFVTIDGVLNAVVKPKTPIARVFDENGSFYIDYQGERMPLSTLSTARVPLVSGEISRLEKSGLADLLRQIHDDSFLKKNIIGLTVARDGSITMMNRNYNYEIEFGKLADRERKFNNYKAFFQKAVTDSSIIDYKKINLKFTQQVVCTK
ncbi:MAG: cell division protein FtsQ [Flavobacterium sp.]|nr:cell division protein FtsQ [Flavobacterium sp.]